MPDLKLVVSIEHPDQYASSISQIEILPSDDEQKLLIAWTEGTLAEADGTLVWRARVARVRCVE